MRFPKYHLAASVVNRILNVADQIAAIPDATEPPNTPNPSKQGQAIDEALSTPPQPVPAPAGSEELVTMENMQDGSAADAISASAIMDSFR